MKMLYYKIDYFWIYVGGSHGGSEYERVIREKKEYKCG